MTGGRSFGSYTSTACKGNGESALLTSSAVTVGGGGAAGGGEEEEEEEDGGWYTRGTETQTRPW